MDGSNQSPDRELWERFVSRGDEESFNFLVQRYKLRLFDVASRVLNDSHAAEDVVQRVFVRLLQRKKDLTEITSLESWLYKATLNLSLNVKKSVERRNRRETAEAVSPASATPREAAANARVAKRTR
jgi:RNA polymerase sigma-70 factor (ECF subfamily)